MDVEDELVDDLEASNCEEEDEGEQEDLVMVGEKDNDSDDNLEL